MVNYDASKFLWVLLHDWSDLVGTDYVGNKVFIKESDIDNFVEHICKKISNKLSIPYAELMPEIIANNHYFYTFKKQIFKLYYSVSRDNDDLVVLMSNFRIPSTSDLENCFQLFQNLSEEEKNIFLCRINAN